MSRRSLFALGAAALMIGSLSLVAGSAQAHNRHRACVTADHGAWLFAERCYRHRHRCWRPAHHGRAFRVLRQEGGYLLVRNHQARGWIELNSVRFAPLEYCRAAGI